MTTNDTYFRGDKAQYTGKSEMFHGERIYELTMIEGHRKGDLLWTGYSPEERAEKAGR